MNYLFSLIPVVIYITLLVFLDSFALVRKQSIAYAMGCGVVLCGVAFVVSLGLEKCLYFVPLLEEMLKGCVVLYLVIGKKIRFFAEALILGAAAGAGFALAENIVYVYYLGDSLAPADALFRGMGTALMHVGLAGLSGVMLLFLASREYLKHKEDKKYMPLWLVYLLTLMPSVLLHYAFNTYINQLPSAVVLGIMATFMLLLFFFLLKLNERAVNEYLETSMSTKVQLLSAIRKGHLSDTKCGLYLMSVKEQFSTEVFFDMLCYLQVSLQVSLIKDREILLADLEMAMPKNPKREEEERSLRNELSALRKRIGKTGFMIIRPLVE